MKWIGVLGWDVSRVQIMRISYVINQLCHQLLKYCNNIYE